MLKDYVLGSEIAEIGNFSVANISMMLKDSKMIEGTDFLKFGGITLLNKKSLETYNYINKIINTNKVTDLSDYVPYTYLVDILQGRFSKIKDKFEIVTVNDKKFVKFLDEDLKKLILNEKFTKSVVNADEVEYLLKDGLIIGSFQLSKSKSLVWY